MDDVNIPRVSPLRLIFTILLAFVLSLALGLYLAPRLIPAPQIGIIRLNYDLHAVSAREVAAQGADGHEEDALAGYDPVIWSSGNYA